MWWGTASAATQAEGAAPASDWARWERLGLVPGSRDGNGFVTTYAGDFETLADLGLTRHRLGLDWARLEPQPGAHDQNAIEHYLAMLTAARDVGVEPWACLHHFSLPGWFSEDAGGFLDDRARSYDWPRHVDFVAQTFGDLVAGWIPIHDPVAYVRAGWTDGSHPPGKTESEDAPKALAALHGANREAWNQLRGGDAPVAAVYGSADDVPDLEDAFDLVGLAHRLLRDGDDVDAWADGFAEGIHRLAEDADGRGVIVGSVGVGTDDDDRRTHALASIRRGCDAAIDGGIDLVGSFHWTAVDGYEWHHGFKLRCGLLDRDRNPRPSATGQWRK